MLILLSAMLVGATISTVDCLDCWQVNLGVTEGLTYDKYIGNGLSNPGCTDPEVCKLSFGIFQGNLRLIAGKCSSSCLSDTFRRIYCCNTDDCNKQLNLKDETAQPGLVTYIVEIISALQQIQCGDESKPSKVEWDALIAEYSDAYDTMLNDLSSADILMTLVNPEVQKLGSSLLECFSCQDVNDESECTETEICRPGEHCGTKVCKGCSSKSSQEGAFTLFSKGCQSSSTCDDLEEETPTMDDVSFCCDTDQCNQITMTEIEEETMRRKRSVRNENEKNKRQKKDKKNKDKKRGDEDSSSSDSSSSSETEECELDQDTDANDDQCTIYEDILKLVNANKLTDAYNELFETGVTTNWCSITSAAKANFGTDTVDPLFNIFKTWNDWVCSP